MGVSYSILTMPIHDPEFKTTLFNVIEDHKLSLVMICIGPMSASIHYLLKNLMMQLWSRLGPFVHPGKEKKGKRIAEMHTSLNRYFILQLDFFLKDKNPPFLQEL